MINLLIVDDQEIIRQSLELMLGSRSGMKVRTATDGRDAVDQVRKSKPDVVLMDIRMPGMDGIEALRIIKDYAKDVKVIMLTTFDDDQYIYDALRYEANGFLLKGISLDELTKSIELVHSGGAAMDAQINVKILSLFSQMAKSDYSFRVDQKDYEDLSLNELKIIQSIGQGLSNKEIAVKLSFTEGTVRNYISSVLKKLNLRDRTQIAIFAIQSSIMIRTFED